MASIWRRVPESGQKPAFSAALPDFGQGFAACAWRLRAWFAYALGVADLARLFETMGASLRIESVQGKSTRAPIGMPMVGGTGGNLYGQA